MSAFDWIALSLMIPGAGFTLLAAVGVLRMPDMLCRLSATSKAAPFGVGLVLAGAAVHVRDPSFALQALVVAVFVGLTAPIAAHALARAALHSGDAGVVDPERTVRGSATSPETDERPPRS